MNIPDNCCEPRRRGRPGVGTAIFGLGLLLFGVVLTLDNLNVLDAGDFVPYWPVLLVLFGLSHIARPAGSRCIGSGIIWIGVGLLILAHNLYWITVDILDLWPLVLVIAGASLLLKPFRRRRTASPDDADTLEATAVLGAVKRHVVSDSFKGGDAMAVLGGCELDLRDAATSGEPAVIEVFGFWGAIEIHVPEDWEVQVKGTAILGAFEDKTRPTLTEKKHVLIIRGTVIMAGVEIKS